jgi:hypothetical protein
VPCARRGSAWKKSEHDKTLEKAFVRKPLALLEIPVSGANRDCVANQ